MTAGHLEFFMKYLFEAEQAHQKHDLHNRNVNARLVPK